MLQTRCFWTMADKPNSLRRDGRQLHRYAEHIAKPYAGKKTVQSEAMSHTHEMLQDHKGKVGCLRIRTSQSRCLCL